MSDTFIGEVFLQVLLFVEAEYPCHVLFLENFNVLGRVVSISLISISFLDGSHESPELARNDPVEVTVLDSFIVFILFDIKCAEIIPSESHSILETL